MLDSRKAVLGKVYGRMFLVGERPKGMSVSWRDDALKIHEKRWEYLHYLGCMLLHMRWTLSAGLRSDSPHAIVRPPSKFGNSLRAAERPLRSSYYFPNLATRSGRSGRAAHRRDSADEAASQ